MRQPPAISVCLISDVLPLYKQVFAVRESRYSLELGVRGREQASIAFLSDFEDLRDQSDWRDTDPLTPVTERSTKVRILRLLLNVDWQRHREAVAQCA